MRLILEKRADRSPFFAIASPFLALLLTLIAGGLIFVMRGINPLEGLYVYFVEPLTQLWSVEQLIVKAAPLVLIGVGLAVCTWPMSEHRGGRATDHGRDRRGHLAGDVSRCEDPSILVVMLIMGAMGGALYGAIPGLLKRASMPMKSSHRSCWFMSPPCFSTGWCGVRGAIRRASISR